MLYFSTSFKIEPNPTAEIRSDYLIEIQRFIVHVILGPLNNANRLTFDFNNVFTVTKINKCFKLLFFVNVN